MRFPSAGGGWFPVWLLQAEPYVDRPGSDARIPPAQRRTLIELDGSTCRWPVGDPAGSRFFFCGGRVAAGRPYCPEHCARAYRGPAISATRNN
jgi:GcrA cell cycle regulator